MDIELFDIQRHDVNAVKTILSMAIGDPIPETLHSLLFEFYSDDDHPLFLSLENNHITGIIGIDCSKKPSGIIEHLAVLPEYRRHGVGRFLIDQTEKILELSSIELETDQYAVDFYRACGFNSAEVERNYPGIHRFRCIRNMIE